MFRTPILFLVFNRPDVTAQVFAKIKEVKPKYLYVAADGPREDKIGESEKCNEVRSLIIDNIDWDCEVKTLFRDKNLGCGLAVSGAITWFFDNVEEGIILEDYCLPDISFFNFCEQLLHKYRDDERIGVISGVNLTLNNEKKYSYFFSYFPKIWGWASWKRVWVNYDYFLESFPNDYDKISKKHPFLNIKKINNYYKDKFYKTKNHKIDTWDYQFFYMFMKHVYISISPMYDLIVNLGMNDVGTHIQKNNGYDFSKKPLNEIIFPLEFSIDLDSDIEVFKIFCDNNKQNVLQYYFNIFKSVVLKATKK